MVCYIKQIWKYIRVMFLATCTSNFIPILSSVFYLSTPKISSFSSSYILHYAYWLVANFAGLSFGDGLVVLNSFMKAFFTENSS